MVQKRPFYDEEQYSISSKHPRQVVPMDSFPEFLHSGFASLSPHAPGVDELTENIARGCVWLDNDMINGPIVSSEEEVKTTVIGASVATSSTNEEVSPSVHLTSPPVYFGPEHPGRTVTRSEDIYSLLMRYPPQKQVPVGSAHQADIPEWSPPARKNESRCSDASAAILDTNSALRDEDEKRKMGSCVITMPEFEVTGVAGNVRTDCSCLDEGFVRCVRHHIMEAREKLKRSLGLERFEELGFCDMGEQVAGRWTEQEEGLFHEVVFSNPASMGKNFWDHISAVFSYRTKEDIVSYYFNVFMLRRRAEQNRCDALSIDSDNDEFQGNDFDGDDDDELQTSEKDEDTVVESPAHEDDCAHDQTWEEVLHNEHNDSVADEHFDNKEDLDSAIDSGDGNLSETCFRKFHDNRSSNPTSQLLGETSWDDRVDQEVQDESCTSSDTGASSQGMQDKAEISDHWLTSFSGFSDESQDNVLDTCNRVWDASHTISPKYKVDFLPTCSMIEEVFGDGSWDCNAGDGKSSS